MESHALEFIKGWLFLPIVGVLGYFIKKTFSDIDAIKEQVAMLKISQAVADSQIKDIREDIKDLVKVVREVEATIVHDIKLLQKDIQDKIK